MSFDHRPGFRASFLLPRYWLLWSVFGLAGITALIPAAARAKLGDWLAFVFCKANSRRKRIALRNLSLCFPELAESQRQELFSQHIRIATHLFLSYGRLLFGSPDWLRTRFDVNGLEIIRAAAAQGNNIILLTPHVMALEYAGLYLNRDYELLTMVRVHKNPVLDWMVSRMRTHYGGKLFSHNAGMLALIRTIRSGKWFYYLPDEDYGADNTIFIPFFGIPKATVPALGKLAQAGRAVVIPMHSAYCPDRQKFSITFYPPLESFPGGEPNRDAQRMNQALEDLINQAPAQYYWTSKIFRTRPQGEAKFY
jgi:lauroyl-KDO2-lipid IV(A) myristoyltransferase